MYIPHISDEIEKRVGEIPGINLVTVETLADEVWTKDQMTDESDDEGEAHFQERIDAHDITTAYDGDDSSNDVTIDTTEADDL